MRICLIGDAQSIHLKRWARAFVKRGHDVHVITDKPAEIEGVSAHPVKLHREGQLLPVRFWNLFARARQTRKIVDEIKPDILHGHFLFAYGFWAMKSGHRPLVTSAWGSDIANIRDDSMVGKWTKEVIRASDLIHTGDKAGLERIVELGGAREKILIQPWGIDVTQFREGLRSEGKRAEILGGKKGLVAITVCSLVPIWDVATFVRAAPLVAEKRGDVLFLVAGGGPDMEKLKALAREVGAEPHVKFLGRVPSVSVPEYLLNSDIYVDSFHSDKAGGGIGTAGMEALCAGLPVVLAHRPGIESAVTEGRNGFTFKGGDPKDAAEKILKLAENPAMRREFGARSRELALRIGDWEKNMDEFDLKYRELLAQKKSGK